MSSSSKIKTFYDNYPNISQYIGHSAEPTTTLEEDAKKLDVKDDKVEAFRREFLYIGGPEVIERNRQKKEHKKPLYTHNAGITDKVAQESSDSNASTHQMHQGQNDDVTSGGNVAANAHKANPGPVHADNLPTPESKADLKKRAEELNK